MSIDFDVKDALTTNKHALDEEWIRQPHLMERATAVLADIEYHRDRSKAKLDYERAKLANSIRADPDEYNVAGNLTDAKVKEIVASDPDMYYLEKIFHEWESDVTAADGVKWALGHKKTGLEDLTKLFLSGYWAKPYISEEAKEEIRKSSEYDQSEALHNNARLKKRAKQKE